MHVTAEGTDVVMGGFGMHSYLPGLPAALALVADHPARRATALGRQRRRKGT
jgi:hypothetical protein